MTAQAPLILVIEDETQIRKFLRATLTAHGYRVEEAMNAREGMLKAGMQPPDVIILDLGLPDMDGLKVTRQLREWATMPIIVLSARGQESDKVAALDAGADDYLTKPFSVPELSARIRVALRHVARGGDSKAAAYTVGDLTIDLSMRTVTLGDREVRLTPTEYNLLASLTKHAGKVLTHEHLLKEVWGPAHAQELQYLRVYMAQLRQKIEPDPAQPRYLLTESGVGYRLAGH